MYAGMCRCLQLVLKVQDDVAENGSLADVKKERDVADRNVYGIDRSDTVRVSAYIIRILNQEVYEV